jgi:hypothetical protein
MKLLIIGIAVLLASCTSQRKIMDTWIGSTKHDLVLKWGPPARVASDGSTGEIYIYENMSMLYNTVRYNHRMFYINSDDKIYSWRTASGPVPAQQMNVNLYIR